MFTMCCEKGKVKLTPYKQSDFFNKLYENLTSTDANEKAIAKNYFENIRSYNAAFSMVSSEARIDERFMRGIYHFKIHGAFYHRAGSIVVQEYGRSPQNAQLYFYDVETANNYRMQNSNNQNCDLTLINQISRYLDRVNPYVQSFYSMKQFCSRPENTNREVLLVITTNRDIDLRRYNDAIATDVAAIFSTADGEPPDVRDVIAFPKISYNFNNRSTNIRRVSTLDSSLDPLAYPCLFPYGDLGWYASIPHAIPTNSRALHPRNKVTMAEYAGYRLAIRDEFSLLHHSGKLFLQWIVDMYIRIEGSRLQFHRNNQSNYRSEVLNNLTDFVAHNVNDNDNSGIGRRVILPSSFIGSPRNMYQNYLDAMTIVQQYGKPSLFITMTCNPNWPEIKEDINNDPSNMRPEIIVRVFKLKLDHLIHIIKVKKILEK